MSYFIKCMAPSYLRDALYVVKDNKPHKLNHPKSLDRDWFKSTSAAAKAKRALERNYAFHPQLKFRIERH